MSLKLRPLIQARGALKVSLRKMEGAITHSTIEEELHK